MKYQIERQDILVHTVDEQGASSFVLNIVRDFFGHVTKSMDIGKPLSDAPLENFLVEEHDGKLCLSFKRCGTEHIFVVKGMEHGKYRFVRPEVFEIMMRMEFSPALVNPYDLDDVFSVLRSVDASMTFGRIYYCAECGGEFHRMDAFVDHLRESGHDDDILHWFPSFFAKEFAV